MNFSLRALLGAAVAGVVSFQAHAADVSVEGRMFHLPDGFTVEKVAASPLVDRPVTGDLDEEGRLYVADSTGTGDNLQKQLKNPPHRIVRLEDTDGDGHFDRQTVFADHVMFPEGTLWFDGSLYSAGVPTIWKFTGAERKAWFEGKTLTGCGNDLHGPYLGPDGWIYWCKGAFAQQTYQRPGHKPLVTRAAHIFRARPDGTGIEPVMTGGMDNPVEVAFTRGGERIFTTTFLVNPANGQRDGIIHAIYGGIYGKIHDVIDDHPHTFPEVMPVLVHTGPAAQCALIRYESDSFGPEFQDNLFASSFNLHKVTRHVLAEEGATFTSRNEDFLVCDNLDFHPTHLVEEADGSLLVFDTGGWYKLCCPTSQLVKPDVLGAIYRVRKVGAPHIEDPRGLKLAWATLQPDALAKLLDDPRPAVRRRAIQALGKTGPAALGTLRDVLASSSSTRARLNAIWACTWITDPRARETARAALQDADPTVRQAAIHSASVWRDSAAFDRLVSLLTTGSAHNRRAAAEALGRLGDARAIPPLLAALEQPLDHVLEHSLTYALIEIADPQATAAGLSHANPHVRRAALMALDQMERPGGLTAQPVAAGLLDADPALSATAAWIAGRHPEWGEALADALGQRMKQVAAGSPEQAALRQNLSKLAKSPAIAALLAQRLTSASAPAEERKLAMSAIAGAGLQPAPTAWTTALTQTLADPDPSIVAGSIATLRRISPAKSAAPDMAIRLMETAQRDDLPQSTRLDALAAMPAPIDHLAPDLFAFVHHQLTPSTPIAQRQAAAEVLAKSRLSPEQLTELSRSIPEAGPLEINRLLAAFTQSTDEQVGLALLASLQNAKALKALRVEMIRPRMAQFGPRVQKEAEALWARLDPDAGAQRAHLDEVLKSLPPGDIRRGQSIFNSQKVGCATCHTIGYVGGNVGPDLTRVGSVRQDRDLLESILYPSASFVQSYEPMTVITRGRDRYDGVLRRNDAQEVLLVTGPNQEVRIPRGDVKEMRPGTVSVMPAGLEEQVSRQELADLVAFLKACR